MRARAVIAIACVLTLAGCNLNTNYFSDYSGKNLLANYGFSATGKWALESYATYAAVTGYLPADYVTWAQIGAGSAADNSTDSAASTPTKGFDNSSPAFRLEIKNLLLDGDFETGQNPGSPVTDGWWAPAGGATDNIETVATANSVGTSYSPISDNSLFFSGPNVAGNTLVLTLSPISVPLWARTGTYRVRFDYRWMAASGSAFHIATNA